MIIYKSTLPLVRVFRKRNAFAKHLQLTEASFTNEDHNPVKPSQVYAERPRSNEVYQLFGPDSRDWTACPTRSCLR